MGVKRLVLATAAICFISIFIGIPALFFSNESSSGGGEQEYLSGIYIEDGVERSTVRVAHSDAASIDILLTLYDEAGQEVIQSEYNIPPSTIEDIDIDTLGVSGQGTLIVSTPSATLEGEVTIHGEESLRSVKLRRGYHETRYLITSSPSERRELVIQNLESSQQEYLIKYRDRVGQEIRSELVTLSGSALYINTPHPEASSVSVTPVRTERCREGDVAAAVSAGRCSCHDLFHQRFEEETIGPIAPLPSAEESESSPALPPAVLQRCIVRGEGIEDREPSMPEDREPSMGEDSYVTSGTGNYTTSGAPIPTEGLPVEAVDISVAAEYRAFIGVKEDEYSDFVEASETLIRESVVPVYSGGGIETEIELMLTTADAWLSVDFYDLSGTELSIDSSEVCEKALGEEVRDNVDLAISRDLLRRPSISGFGEAADDISRVFRSQLVTCDLSERTEEIAFARVESAEWYVVKGAYRILSEREDRESITSYAAVIGEMLREPLEDILSRGEAVAGVYREYMKYVLHIDTASGGVGESFDIGPVFEVEEVEANPSPTPEISASPVVSPSPSASPSPSVSPSVTPSPEVSPSPTATPSLSPTPVLSPVPSPTVSTPTPTATLTPTHTPSVSPSSSPSPPISGGEMKIIPYVSNTTLESIPDVEESQIESLFVEISQDALYYGQEVEVESLVLLKNGEFQRIHPRQLSFSTPRPDLLEFDATRGVVRVLELSGIQSAANTLTNLVIDTESVRAQLAEPLEPPSACFVIGEISRCTDIEIDDDGDLTISAGYEFEYCCPGEPLGACEFKNDSRCASTKARNGCSCVDCSELGKSYDAATDSCKSCSEIHPRAVYVTINGSSDPFSSLSNGNSFSPFTTPQIGGFVAPHCLVLCNQGQVWDEEREECICTNPGRTVEVVEVISDQQGTCDGNVVSADEEGVISTQSLFGDDWTDFYCLDDFNFFPAESSDDFVPPITRTTYEREEYEDGINAPLDQTCRNPCAFSTREGPFLPLDHPAWQDSSREYCSCEGQECCEDRGGNWSNEFCGCSCQQYEDVGSPLCADGYSLDSDSCTCVMNNQCGEQIDAIPASCEEGQLDVHSCGCKRLAELDIEEELLPYYDASVTGLPYDTSPPCQAKCRCGELKAQEVYNQDEFRIDLFSYSSRREVEMWYERRWYEGCVVDELGNVGDYLACSDNLVVNRDEEISQPVGIFCGDENNIREQHAQRHQDIDEDKQRFLDPDKPFYERCGRQHFNCGLVTNEFIAPYVYSAVANGPLTFCPYNWTVTTEFHELSSSSLENGTACTTTTTSTRNWDDAKIGCGMPTDRRLDISPCNIRQVR